MTGFHLAAGLTAALAAAALPSQASASAYGGSNYSLASAKGRAILGGSAPSRLEEIMARQSGKPLPVVVAPAALSIPTLRTADLRTYRSSARPWTGRPDLFGTVALRVGQTSLDSRWDRVANAGLPATAASFSRGLAGADRVETIEAVNRYVNGRIRFTDDSRQFGRADHWSTASESLRRGRGDCEDYAIAKMQMLRAAGIPARDLFLVLVKDTVRRADHAVLVVRADGRNLLLDNGTDRVLDAEAVRDYRPIFTFAATGTWTHGYRRFDAPVSIAARDDKQPSADVKLAGLNARGALRFAPSSPASAGSSAHSYGP